MDAVEGVLPMFPKQDRKDASFDSPDECIVAVKGHIGHRKPNHLRLLRRGRRSGTPKEA